MHSTMTKKPRAGTYAAFAQAEADQPRGRFDAIDKTEVTGSAPAPQYPVQPQNSPWASDPVGPEAPLGYSVDEPPMVGEAFEIEKSLSGARDASSSPAAPRQDASLFGDGSAQRGSTPCPTSDAQSSPPLRKRKRR